MEVAAEELDGVFWFCLSLRTNFEENEVVGVAAEAEVAGVLSRVECWLGWVED